jgi:hypothetical protein
MLDFDTVNAVNRFSRNSSSAFLASATGAKTSPREVAGSTGHALET